MRDQGTALSAETAEEDEYLLATCWSSAGDAASDRDDLRSPLSLRERIEAASAAGFRGFGLLSADLPAAEEEYGLSGIRQLLDDNGIVHVEMEGIPYWWDDGPQREESDRIRRMILIAAEALGVVVASELYVEAVGPGALGGVRREVAGVLPVDGLDVVGLAA